MCGKITSKTISYKEKGNMNFVLSNGWKMRSISGKNICPEYVPAKVPGSVYGTLMDAGIMDDPFYRDNEIKALEVIEDDYEFAVSFDRDKELTGCDRILLHFDGIDTLSKITLNGVVLGRTDNMHRTWEYDVTDIIVEKDNSLSVELFSPTKFIADADEKRHIAGATESMRGFPVIRKAHCMFGWDWGARIPDAGIFRAVSLVGIEKKRINNVHIMQRHEEGKVTLSFDVRTDDGVPVSGIRRDAILGCGNGEPAEKYIVKLTAPDGTVSEYDSPKEIAINNPKLWWPNGYGEQNLYGVCVELTEDGKTVDTWNKRIGLRTMTVAVEDDEYGQCFAHEVNGVRIFAMGGDYIPEDNLLGRVGKERTEKLLKDAAAAHYNVIRVWGGGYYPDDFFYDICDELGLIVWQDFMFACASYDLNEKFEESITAEAIDNIVRLRHHASLGLWCGNNEMESFIYWHKDEWCLTPKEYSDYINMYEYIFPKLVKAYDPQTFYWPSSPSSGGAFDEPCDENRGDTHYWDVWHGNKPITEYRKFYFRYVSEFGFQSFPSLKTVESFTEPEDRNIFSYVMERHQRNVAANGKIMNYMEQTFLYPTSFEMLMYASQLLQAEAIRYGVEHFRRNRGRCMGCVVWQLNDNWPVASWSSIDYYGRWKALHYYEKRMFAPLMISCSEEGTLTQDPNVNAQPYDVKKSITLCGSNESMSEHRVKIYWELRHADSSVIRSSEEELVLPPLSSVKMDKVELPEADIYSDYVSYRMVENGETVSAGTVLFCPPKFFKFVKPAIKVEINGDKITVSSDVYAKSVRIINDNDDMILEDNYFDLNGDSRTVKIVSGKPDGVTVNSVYDIR